MPLRPVEIVAPRVIVGEGAGDDAFFRHLCVVHQINGVQSLDAGGTGKLAAFLKDLPSLTGFFRHCKMLIVVGDSDDRPEDSFKGICKAFKKAKLPVPDSPLKPMTRSQDEVTTVGFTLPFDKAGQGLKGCLETLLLESALARRPELKGCIEAFGVCVKVDTWANSSHVDKFKLRALLSSVFPDDPNFGLQWALDPKHDVIPLDHPVFSPIVDFLRSLP